MSPLKLIVKEVRAVLRDATKSMMADVQSTVPTVSLIPAIEPLISHTVNQRLNIESDNVVTVGFQPAILLIVPVALRAGRLPKLTHCLAAAAVIAVFVPSTPLRAHSSSATTSNASSRSSAVALPLRHCTASVGNVGVGCQSLNSDLIYLTEGGNQVGSLVLIYNENTASIFSVEVLNKHRGKGYGKKLVVEAINRAKSKGSYVLELNTETDNTVANNLYQSLGFELRGLKDDFNSYIKTL